MLDHSDDCERGGDRGGRADYLDRGGEAEGGIVWRCLLDMQKFCSFFLSCEVQ